MSILLDIEAVPEAECNDCIESLFKAMSQSDGGERSMWALHENEWIRDHVEEVTRRLQAILEKIQDALSLLFTGKPIGELAKSDAPWMRWSAAKMSEVKAQLEAKPTADYTLDDWLMVCDYLVAFYLPEGVIQTEADHLTVRAAIAGKLQATIDLAALRKANMGPDRIVQRLPYLYGEMPPYVLSPVEREVVRFARVRSAENISNVTDDARHRMKGIVIRHVEAQVIGDRGGTAQSLRSELFDNFGQLNRDFRRIAVTEAGDACNQGFIAAQGKGARVRRQEAYKGACPFCKSINGQEFNVVEPTAPDKNGDTDVWLGKSNVGRSASPRERTPGGLIERASNARWWPAAGVQHPHCRGSWTYVPSKPPEVSAEYASWLNDLLKSTRT